MKKLVFAKAEVICSNCGKKPIVKDYTYGEPCRYCGYKRTELIRAFNQDYFSKLEEVAA